ncbi:energy transducer TonB [Caulobacter radicis]|uniref:TonB-dependent receptor n=1 Tax=Caulobacter radicis TaxID=2172650 RepID=UPI000D5813C4|nr:TonB-dependent receptor [Caulobacter radicis]PVM91108.1 energy transducer TonB [Caulobacter radicis]
MKRAMMATAAMAVALGAAGQAWSQDEKAERLPKVSIEATAAAPPAAAYQAANPVDSGTSKITRRALEDRTPGNGDVIETLKILPFANFDSNQGVATQESIQDLRPANVSISGGQFYDNYFAIDGVGVNSRLDVVGLGGSNLQNYNETGGASAQSIWLDTNLIESLTVRDSNISAQYGGFTGGVVQVETRQPSHVFGGSVTVGCTNDDMTSFKIPNATKTLLAGVEPEHPKYDKCKVNATVDLPINEKVRVLLGAGRQETEMTYYRHANYGGTPFGLKSRSDNVLAKVEVDLAPDLTLRGQVAYSPYTSENSAENARNAVMTQKGGGLTGKLELAGKRDAADWSLVATYTKADSSRDAPSPVFAWPSSSVAGGFCASTGNCTEGSFGNLDQWQKDIGLQARWSQPLLGGDLRIGADYSHVEARKRRPQDDYSYRTGKVHSTIVCPTGDIACRDGDVVLTAYSIYKAYDISVDLDAVSAFAEYEVNRGPLTVRAGLRYDHESLLANHSFAPRLSVVYELPWDVTATVGVNRYYSRDFLGYAIRSKYPGNYTYERSYNLVNGKAVIGPWALSAHSISATVSGTGVKTPYSDELTFALSKPIFGGVARLKGVAREADDQFTSSVTETVTYVQETGRTSTYRLSRLSNGGESSYRGLSAEWSRSVGRHTFSLNGSVSETSDNLGDNGYDSIADEGEYGDERVYYKGEVRSLLAVIAENDRLNYAAPGLANADWSADWWNGRIRTNLNARWRSGYDQIEDTGATQLVSGTRYAVWDVIRYKSQTTFNANVQAQVAKTAYGEARLDLRVTNLFDTLPQTVTAATRSQPYRMGRSFWVGMSYKF